MTPLGLNAIARPEPGFSDAVEDVRRLDHGGNELLDELRRQLLEKEAQLQEQYKTLALFRSIKNEQDATIERLTAEINSYRETTTEVADARERDRELTLLTTHVAFLEDTVATRGALIEEQLRRMQALQSAREQLSGQLDVLQRTCDERLSLIERLSRQIHQDRASNPCMCEELSAELGVLQRICDERLSLIHKLSQQIAAESASKTTEKTSLQLLKAKLVGRLPLGVLALRNKLRRG